MIDILELRQKLYMTQTEFAELMGVSRQTVYNWEMGRFEPTPEYKKKLLKVLEISKKIM